MSPDYISWCSVCKIPFRDPNNKCNLCNQVGNRLTTDIRPVFARERAILEYFGHNVMQKSVWTGSRSRIYFVDGKKIKIPPWVEHRDHADFIRKFILSKEEQFEELDYKILQQYKYEIQASKFHLKLLEKEAFEFTKNVSDRYKRRMQMVSFSGGKDSTVVSDLVRRALGNDNILHVFGDTKLEDQNTYQYLDEFQMLFPNVPFFIASSEQDFFSLIDHMGPPSRIMRWCCTIIKAGPINNFLQSLGEKIKVLTYYGVRHAESTQRADYNAVTVGAKIGTQVTASPIIDWNEFDVWGYILLNDLHFNKSYRLGYSRVGCWLCPLNSTWSDFLNSIHFKEDNDLWQQYLIDFAKKLGKPDPEVYVKERKWAARYGGAGLQNRWLGIDIKPCGDMDNTIEINLTKEINKDFLEFIKPLGKIDENKSDPQRGIYFTKKRGQSGHNIMIQAIMGESKVRVTALDPSEADNVHRYAKYQFNKFQTCIQCTACSVACPHSAILVRPEHAVYEIDQDKCVNCNECVTHFGSTGCLVAKSLSSYGEDKKNNLLDEKQNAKDGLPNIIMLDMIKD